MKRTRGFTLLEVLIAMIIIAVGLLGVAALQGHSSRAEMESYQRAQALILVSDMLNRIDANRAEMVCYANINAPTQAGTGQPGTYTCTYGQPALQLIANNDLAAWHKLLTGGAENSAVGAMVNAYGCITFNGVDTLTVAVYWQGLAPTVDSAIDATCTAAPSYGAGMRRGVSRSLQIAQLP